MPRSSTALPTCSPAWAGLKKGEATLLNGSKWIAGRNSYLSVQFDKWLNKGTLQSMILGLLNKVKENLKLKDMTSFYGWNQEGLSFNSPNSLLLEMKATLLPFSNQGEDLISWYSFPNGKFKLKEAYRIVDLVDNSTTRQDFKSVWVWKVLSLPKIKCFLWKWCHQSIPV